MREENMLTGIEKPCPIRESILVNIQPTAWAEGYARGYEDGYSLCYNNIHTVIRDCIEKGGK